jgi:hypothetical protein
MPHASVHASAAKVDATPRMGKWMAAGLCAITVAFGVPAKAQTVSVTSVAVPLYDTGLNVTLGSTTHTNVIAGQIVLTGTDSAMPTKPAFNIYAWCVDLYHDINIGTNPYTFTIGGLPTTNGNGVAISAAVGKQLATLAAYGNTLLAGVNAGNVTVSTAVQLAIWQTEYSTANGGPGFSYTYSGSDSAALATDIAAFESYAISNTQSAATLVPLGGQQQLITNTVAAPEPVTVGLLATGLLGLAFVRRRTPARKGALIARQAA